MGQVQAEAVPRFALVEARPDFTARRAEVEADGIERVGAHRLALHREPALRFGKALSEALPALARVAAAKYHGLAADGHAGPDGAAVHGKDPQFFWIARMQHHREAD